MNPDPDLDEQNWISKMRGWLLTLLETPLSSSLPHIYLRTTSRVSTGSFENRWGKYKTTIYYPVNETNNSLPAVVFAHGWGARKEWYSWIGDSLAGQGYVVLLFNVPSRFSFNPWQWPDGIRSAIDYLSCQSPDLVDLNRIGTMGHSMGGLGVLIAGSLDSRIKCAVCLSPPVHANLFHLPKRFGIPIQLQIGIRDKLVPAEKVKAFYADLLAVEKEIVEISGGNHVQFMDLPLGGFLDNRATVSVKEQHSASFRRFIKWFDRYLKP